MKKIFILFSLSLVVTSCSDKQVMSEKELLTEQTKKTVLKAFNAQMEGKIDIMKSLLADDFTFTLTGQLDISKTYTWEEYLKFARGFLLMEDLHWFLLREGWKELEANMKMIMQ